MVTVPAPWGVVDLGVLDVHGRHRQRRTFSIQTRRTDGGKEDEVVRMRWGRVEVQLYKVTYYTTRCESDEP